MANCLHFAASSGDIDMFNLINNEYKKLVDEKEIPIPIQTYYEMKNLDNYTPLMFAAQMGVIPGVSVTDSKNYVEIVEKFSGNITQENIDNALNKAQKIKPESIKKTMIEALEGLKVIDVPSRTDSSSENLASTRTPTDPSVAPGELIEAVKTGDIEKAGELIAAGAKVDEKDKFGNTPLHWAALKGHTEIVAALLEKANKEVEEKDGWTPLHYAANKPNAEHCEAAGGCGRTRRRKISLEQDAAALGGI